MNLGQITKVTSKGQTTIPEIIRNGFNIQPGDKINWFEILVEGNYLIFKIQVIKDKEEEKV